VLEQRARAVAQVGGQRLERADAARVTGLFLVLLHRTETPQRLQPGVFRAHAQLDILLGFHLHVKADFGVQPAIELTVSQQCR
jgi:hypothetical protein